MKTLKLTKKKEKYSEYKDSGVEWLGEVPKGWRVDRSRYLLEERKEKNTNLVTDNILSVTRDRGVIRYNDKGDIGNKSSSRPENYKIVYPNDLVLNSMNLVIGSMGIATELGVTSNVYIVYKTKDVSLSRFTYYLFRSEAFQKYLAKFGKGIMELREAIKHSDIKTQYVPVPTIEQQQKIADYLDQKTETIDKIIEKKKRLVALLEEKRASVINHAVTKGLDPNAELVDSGIDWIGKIPKGWEVRKLKYVSWLNYGNSLSEDERIEGKTKVYGSNGVVGNHNISNTKSPVIIVGRKGSHGKIQFSDAPVFAIDTTYFIDEYKVINSKCLYYILKSMNLSEISLDTGVPGLSRFLAHNKSIPLFTIKEQNTITEYLDKKTSLIDMVIEKTNQSIKLLQEYRASLISNVVSGKIKI